VLLGQFINLSLHEPDRLLVSLLVNGELLGQFINLSLLIMVNFGYYNTKITNTMQSKGVSNYLLCFTFYSFCQIA